MTCRALTVVAEVGELVDILLWKTPSARNTIQVNSSKITTATRHIRSVPHVLEDLYVGKCVDLAMG
jgi:hypothetical protein